MRQRKQDLMDSKSVNERGVYKQYQFNFFFLILWKETEAHQNAQVVLRRVPVWLEISSTETFSIMQKSEW